MNDINQQLQEKVVELEQQKAIIDRQSEFLRSIYDNVREATFVVDIETDGTFRYQGFNAAAIKLTGIVEVKGKTPEQILPEAAAATVKQHYTQCVQSRTSVSYEECLPFQNEDTWWLTTLSPLSNRQGEIYRIVGTSLNINDRKRAELELAREKIFLQTLLDNLSDGIVACDEHGVITLFNRATREFHGLGQAAIPAEDWADYFDLYAADGRTIMPMEDIPLYRALQGESIRDVEMSIVPKQGQPRTLLANGDPIINRQGKKIGAIVSMRDITARKQVELELESEQVFIKTLLDNLSDGIVACDRQGALALFNQASLNLFAEPLTALPPAAWAEHYSLYDAEGKDYLTQTEIPLVRAFAGESFINAELMAKPPAENPRHLLANGSPLIDAKGNKIGAVVAVRDITERKQAELALAELNEELEDRVRRRTGQLEKINALLLSTTATLERRNQELDRFAYIASHDLRAPLRAIANLSQWLEEDLADKLDSDTRHNMNLLRSRVGRLESLINGLLVYSRVGRTNTKPELVPVGQMLAEIIDLLDVSPNCEVIVEAMPTFVTQLIPLQQVFNNLLNNALQHNRDRLSQIKISVREQDNFYEFSVADDGKGIASADQERIFTIFHTLEAKDKLETTGIGLSIVKKSVESQGGIISVESQLDSGSVFRFTWQKATKI
ncbi:MAG: PAS domain-containing protein [Cyanobacteria bacterium J06623_7]